MHRRVIHLLVAASTAALLVMAAIAPAVTAGQRSQSSKTSNDACVLQWPASVASYRIDWTSYYDLDTATWYYGYVENASNTASAVLDGVDVFATPADLVSGGSTDPTKPDATVSVFEWSGPILGAIGFYGQTTATTIDEPWSLAVYDYSRSLGSYTVCFADSGVPPR